MPASGLVYSIFCFLYKPFQRVIELWIHGAVTGFKKNCEGSGGLLMVMCGKWVLFLKLWAPLIPLSFLFVHGYPHGAVAT